MNAISEFQGEYRWLSNFFEAPAIWNGYAFHTAENAYQCAKNGSGVSIAEMRGWDLLNPAAAKRKGRLVACARGWKNDRIGVMHGILLRKFTHPTNGMRRKLIDTDDTYLMEGNRWGDTFWGVDLATGAGFNFLGSLLMQVREEIR